MIKHYFSFAIQDYKTNYHIKLNPDVPSLVSSLWFPTPKLKN